MVKVPAGIGTNFIPMEFSIAFSLATRTSAGFAGSSASSDEPPTHSNTTAASTNRIQHLRLIRKGLPVRVSLLAPVTSTISVHESEITLLSSSTTRNPTTALVSSGAQPSRLAHRRNPNSESHDPPRRTRTIPDSGPCGSVLGELAKYFPLYQSLHHSQTFPSISYSPIAFGCLHPTACVFKPLFASHHAYLASSAPSFPKLNAVLHRPDMCIPSRLPLAVDKAVLVQSIRPAR